MSYYLVKTGGTSIILGEGHYKQFLPPKKNKLLKITKINPRHNEFRWLSKVREIENYEKYFSIPDEVGYLLESTHSFYYYLKDITRKERMTIFHGNLQCNYISFAGQLDILDTFSDIIDHKTSNIWKNYGDILRFAKHIMEGISQLHRIKICHLDLKPENMIIDLSTRQFRIVDFGFASYEPFIEYRKSPNGTPGYFPKQFDFDIPQKWLPKIEANDCIKENGKTPMELDHKLVYKVDSYSFGRILYFLRYIMDDNFAPSCWFCNEKNNIDSLDQLIELLTENDVYKRPTIDDCYEKIFV